MANHGTGRRHRKRSTFIPIRPSPSRVSPACPPVPICRYFHPPQRKSRGLIQHLLREAKKGESETVGWCLGPSIGDCIRSISITVEDELRDCHNCTTGVLAGFHQRPVPSCRNRHAEPGASCLDDAAELDVQPRLLKAILHHASSESGRLRDLAFTDYMFSFYDEPERIHASVPSHPMRLRSFALGDAEADNLTGYDGCAAYLAETIPRRCASTLEPCVWNAWIDGLYTIEDFDGGRICFRDGPIEFPKLRKFWAYIRCCLNMEPSVLENSLAAPLESFAPSAKLCSIMIDHNLVDKFPLPHLRTFAITNTKLNYTDIGKATWTKCLA